MGGLTKEELETMSPCPICGGTKITVYPKADSTIRNFIFICEKCKNAYRVKLDHQSREKGEKLSKVTAYNAWQRHCKRYTGDSKDTFTVITID